MVHSSWYEEFQITTRHECEQLSIFFVATMNYHLLPMNFSAATMNHELSTIS